MTPVKPQAEISKLLKVDRSQAPAATKIELSRRTAAIPGELSTSLGASQALEWTDAINAVDHDADSLWFFAHPIEHDCLLPPLLVRPGPTSTYDLP